MGIVSNNRGMALLLTLLVISIIVVVTLQFNTAMRLDAYEAANLRDGIKLGYTARSAFNLAREVLYHDAGESTFDSLNETWAKLPEYSGYSALLLGGERVDLTIADHTGKIQINALVYAENPDARQRQRELLERFLQSEEFGLSTEEVNGILAALQDWLDQDDEVSGLDGAEEAYYQELDRPYSCRNGPVEFLEDLLLVKGISRELFYGTEEQPGLKDFLTPYGVDGKININTADPMVLRVLSDGIDAELAESMAEYRGNEENDLSESGWYKNVPGFPGDIDIAPGLLTVSSVYFEIRATAFLDAMSSRITGIVHRGDGGIPEVIAWQIE